ncbi:sodium/glutamate symporter [Aporhodopirellula aestuarii]|uniref:Sodium:glutamate symporter n=1 Tax=Aporhodopirellula aestuarii TaxID=2950107 RepID=A0ABT0U323_9BACT|nr:sodium:glutamate symporter [Aporhodopirellula aestuarii]MCM2370975.1 sodium:glutamate symporter [Aporhodopirellula aestuarii]
MLGAIILTAVLLVLGVVIRGRFGVLAVARIPASLIAGAIGLAVWQIAIWSVSGNDAEMPRDRWTQFVQSFAADSIANLRSWPGWLIAVVFAGMLLTRSPQNHDSAGRNMAAKHDEGGFSPVAREALMVWIIVLGQTAVGLWLVWWWIGPQFQLPNSAAMLIETGFAGGHGTAAAMGTVFVQPPINLDEGLDLGVLMATSGLVYGLVSGILWIEIGVRRGWVAADRKSAAQDSIQTPESQRENTVSPTHSRRPPGASISDAIEPMLLQCAFLIVAFAIGVGLQSLGDALAGFVDASGIFASGASDAAGDQVLRDRLRIASVVGSFPLFIYTLFGGAIVRFFVVRTAGEHWIDHDTISRLVGASMDLLVVAAVVTLNLTVVVSLWVPITALFVAGAAWSTFCLLFLSPKILPESHWFELGLINFGMSTGTTATGFVLLRVIDPELKTRAAEHYALAAPLSAPFIGGGMITVGLPLLVLERIPIALSAVLVTGTLVFLVVWGVYWKTKLKFDEAFPKQKTGADSRSADEIGRSR